MPAEFPDGWTFCGTRYLTDSKLNTVVVLEARKSFYVEKSPVPAELVVQAQNHEMLVKVAEHYEWLIQRACQAELILVPRTELSRILEETILAERSVERLQQKSTLQEEQLRAYRRMQCSQEQVDNLKKDLEETTARVLASYGMKPTHEIPLPRVANGV